MKSLVGVAFVVFLVGSLAGCGGGGGGRCPGDSPLACSTGGCCPRGYPYDCGNGLCYQYGCPAGSPEIGICEFKLATSDLNKIEQDLPMLSEDEAGLSMPHVDSE